MATMNSKRLGLLLAIAGLGLILLPGCVLFDGKFTVGVDGSTDVELTFAVARGFMAQAQEEGDPVEELKKEAPEDWAIQPYETEEWHGVRLTRRAAPGEAPLPPAKGQALNPQDVKVTAVKRLLCTDYQVAGILDFSQAGPDQKPRPRASASPRLAFVQQQAGQGNEGDEENGGMLDPQAMAGLLGALAQKPQFTFRVKAPGSVLSTTGTVGEGGVTVWEVPLQSEGTMHVPKPLEIRHVTRLVNQQNVGRLADQLAAEKDMEDMAALISDYVTRDLLPNPPKADPFKATLDVEAYHDALAIITTLEDLFGKRVAEQVVRGLKLNADNVTAKELADLWAAVNAADPEELAGIVADGLILRLRGQQK